jgi:ATP-dependent Lhr-like helicase
MARKRARIPSITGGGAIADVSDYQVRQEPDNTFVGTLNEDFAVEANVGDIFQLGNTSWRILKVERGVVRVADAKGQPPSIPFWLGEGPSRTAELSSEIAQLRDDIDDLDNLGLPPEAITQIRDYIEQGKRVLGVVPTQKRVVLERFFDESGGMQLVLHAPFGGRINRAWGLALRKRFCRGFGFELQAAANEEAIVISLGQHHSFPLEDVFDFLHPDTVRKVLTQAILDQPMFESRWRWNTTRALLLEKFQRGRMVAPQIMRMRAGDLLASAFPAAVACPENLPPGDLEVPTDHPIVRQTIEDCLTEATDIDGLIEVLRGLRDGSIERVAVDTAEPSAFARGILNSAPYTFLDDAPLEERRTQAVLSRRSLDPKTLDAIGALDPAAVERVRGEAWPQPESAEEVHDALLWMGYVTDTEAATWRPWLIALAEQSRVVHEDGRWRAVDGPTDPKKILLGRLEALGPVFDEDPLLLQLEHEGAILRTRLNGRTAWCERRLLARIHRYTIDACAARSSRQRERVPAFPLLLAARRSAISSSTARAASPRCCRSWRASKCRRRSGKVSSSRSACAATNANGSTSSPSAASSRGGDSGAGPPARSESRRWLCPARASRPMARAHRSADTEGLCGAAQDLLKVFVRRARCSRSNFPRPPTSCRRTWKWASPICSRTASSPATPSPRFGR